LSIVTGRTSAENYEKTGSKVKPDPTDGTRYLPETFISRGESLPVSHLREDRHVNLFIPHAFRRISALLAAATAMTGVSMTLGTAGEPGASNIHAFTMRSIDGNDVPLAAYAGKVMLVVNVASRCGYTPQYRDLEALYERYRDRGLVVLGFPANNFGGQEPGNNEEIKSFCSATYGVTFPLFSKISVKGSDQHPLYAFLTADPEFGGDVKWNFQKYLVDRSGRVIGKFSSSEKPLSKKVTTAVEAALASGE
jgi:glutathione peroxidase